MGEKQGQPNNARLIAELQAVTLGIHLFGLDRLPEVMGPGSRAAVSESPYDDCDPEPDGDDDDGLDECGMYADGFCSLVGTEWCDWSCPRGGLDATRPTGEDSPENKGEGAS